jgi:hypothetical protein
MKVIHAAFKNINQVKDKELLSYYHINNYLVNKLLCKSNKDNLLLINSIKECLPEPIIRKTLELNQINQSFLLIKDSITPLVISKEDWELYLVGNYFSVVIPFVNKTVRLPLKVSEEESINTLMTLIQNKLMKGNMYIETLGSHWKVRMELY